MSTKGSWQRPGKGFDEGYDRIHGTRPPKPRYVPPPLPEWAKKQENNGDKSG